MIRNILIPLDEATETILPSQFKGIWDKPLTTTTKMTTTTATTTASTTVRTTTVKAACADTYSRCAEWATNGECDRNRSFMKAECCAACKAQKAMKKGK